MRFRKLGLRPHCMIIIIEEGTPATSKLLWIIFFPLTLCVIVLSDRSWPIAVTKDGQGCTCVTRGQIAVLKQCSVDTDGPNVSCKNIPHTVGHVAAWIIYRTQYGSLLSWCLCQILCLLSKCCCIHCDSPEEATFFHLRESDGPQFSVLGWQGLTPSLFFHCCRPSAPRFNYHTVHLKLFFGVPWL